MKQIQILHLTISVGPSIKLNMIFQIRFERANPKHGKGFRICPKG